MKRVVITGMGIISSIGNNIQEVQKSLYDGKSGIIFAEDYKEMGFRSHVKGNIDVDLEEKVDRRLLRFMGDGLHMHILQCNRLLLIVVSKKKKCLISKLV